MRPEGLGGPGGVAGRSGATRAVVGPVNGKLVVGGAVSGSGGGGGVRRVGGGGGITFEINQTGGEARGGNATSPSAIMNCIQKISPAVTTAPAPMELAYRSNMIFPPRCQTHIPLTTRYMIHTSNKKV
jgi:hypothetical protein